MKVRRRWSFEITLSEDIASTIKSVIAKVKLSGSYL
jgi:hypothetical protein